MQAAPLSAGGALPGATDTGSTPSPAAPVQMDRDFVFVAQPRSVVVVRAGDLRFIENEHTSACGEFNGGS